MREVDLLYLIDQRVVFTREGEHGSIAAGSLGMCFDRMEHIKVNETLMARLLQHFDIYYKDVVEYGTRLTLGRTLGDESNNSLFYIDYHTHSDQVVKIEAEIADCGVLNVRLTYKGGSKDDENERWVDNFSYSGKYEVWWKQVNIKEAS